MSLRLGHRLTRTAIALFCGGWVAAAGGDVRARMDVDRHAVMADDAAPTLGVYRFFTDSGARRPRRGLVPYDLNTPLFSDYAVKARYLYLPPGTTAGYRANGVFDFPVGAVLIKTFAFPADLRAPNRSVRNIETRLLIRKVAGWTARTYVWNAEQTQAVWKVAGRHVPIGFIDLAGRERAISYVVPNQNQCKECHSVDGVLSPIGPKARNLNGVFPYPEGAENQIAHWARLERLSKVPAPAAWPRAAIWNAADEPLAARARAYLDVNCGHCHNRSGFAGNSGLYLDLDEQDATARGVLKRPVAAGRASGDLDFDIVPGDPDHSILIYRMTSDEPGVMMPQIGRSVAHQDGLALIRAYVKSLNPVTPDGGGPTRLNKK